MRPILFKSARRAIAVLMLFSIGAPAQQSGIAADDPAERLSGYLRTLAGDPHDVAALNGAGRAALEIGDVNGALGFYGRAETAAPQNGDAKAGLAAALVQLEQPRRALPLFAQAVQLGVPVGRIAADRGLAYDLLGDNASAQRDYAVALAAAESDETRRRYALSLGIAGQRQKALDLLDPLVRRSDPAGWRARAFVLALTGDTPAASAIVEAMMPSQSSAMQPFLVELSGLTPAQKAAAVNFGDMPSAAAAGGAGTQLAAREAMPMPVPAPIGTVGAMLVPGGAPLGRLSSSPATTRVVPSGVAPQPAPRQPVVPLDRSVAQAVIRRQAAMTAAVLPPPSPRVVAASPPVGSAIGLAPTRPAQIASGAPMAAAPAPETAPASLPAAVPTPAAQVRVAPAVVDARAAPAPVPAPTQLAAIERPEPAMAAASGAAPGLIGPPAPAEDRLAAGPNPPPASIATTQVPVSSAPSGPDAAVPAPATPAPRAPLPAAPIEPDVPAAPERGPSAPVAKTSVPKADDERTRDAKTRPSRAEPSGDVDTDKKRSHDSTSASGGQESASGRNRSGTSDDDESKPDRADRSAKAHDAKSRNGTDARANETDRAARTDRSDRKTRDASADDGKPADSAESRHGRSKSDDAGDDAGSSGKKTRDRKVASADASETPSTRRKAKDDDVDKADGSSARVYVQVAGGANKDDMDKAWTGVKKQASALLKDKKPSTTPLRFTNRLLVGPFKDEDEAQGFVNKLAGKGVSGFVFKSAKGQKIEKIDTSK